MARRSRFRTVALGAWLLGGIACSETTPGPGENGNDDGSGARRHDDAPSAGGTTGGMSSHVPGHGGAHTGGAPAHAGHGGAHAGQGGEHHASGGSPSGGTTAGGGSSSSGGSTASGGSNSGGGSTAGGGTSGGGATLPLAGCEFADLVDRTEAAADRQITWDFGITSSPERCMKITAGQNLVFVGAFSSHPLGPLDGDSPNPFASFTQVDNLATVTFPNPGIYAFECGIHTTMRGAIVVVE